MRNRAGAETLVEDVLLNRRPDSTERLVAYGEALQGGWRSSDNGKASEEWRSGTVEERLTHASSGASTRI